MQMWRRRDRLNLCSEEFLQVKQRALSLSLTLYICSENRLCPYAHHLPIWAFTHLTAGEQRTESQLAARFLQEIDVWKPHYFNVKVRK